MSDTRGLLYVHSTPPALCPHIEWAATGALGVPVDIVWKDQSALPGSRRAELSWHGPEGTGARLTSALRGWDRIRFEVTEDAGSGGEGHRWSFTPALGIFHAATTLSGDITVDEERIRLAIEQDATGAKPLRIALDELLGTPWDDELEVFRHAGEDDMVRWLHRAV